MLLLGPLATVCDHSYIVAKNEPPQLFLTKQILKKMAASGGHNMVAENEPPQLFLTKKIFFKNISS